MWGNSLNTKLADKDLFILCLVCSFSEILSQCPKCCTRHNNAGTWLEDGSGTAAVGSKMSILNVKKTTTKFLCSTDFKLLS
jgi:hypothetical protein